MSNTQGETGGKIAATILHQLRHRILNWHYRPGFHLSEKLLCEEFQVSRVPVREALQTLTEQGLVDKIPNQGCYIKQPDLDEIYDLYEVRLALELHVGEIVTQKGLPAQWVAKQREVWQSMLSIRANDPVDPETLVEADALFHLGLARAAGNRRLVQLLEDCEQRLKFIRLMVGTTPHRYHETAGEHLAILDAILKKNSSEVRKSLHQNIGHSRNKVELALGRVIMNSFRRNARSNGIEQMA